MKSISYELPPHDVPRRLPQPGQMAVTVREHLASYYAVLVFLFGWVAWGACAQNWAVADHYFKYSLPLEAGHLVAHTSSHAGLKTEHVRLAFDGYVGKFGVGTTITKAFEQDVDYCDVEAALDELTKRVALLSVLDAFNIFNVKDIVPSVSDLCDASEALRTTFKWAAGTTFIGLAVVAGLAALRWFKVGLGALAATALLGAVQVFAACGVWRHQWLSRSPRLRRRRRAVLRHAAPAGTTRRGKSTPSSSRWRRSGPVGRSRATSPASAPAAARCSSPASRRTPPRRAAPRRRRRGSFPGARR